MKKYTLCLIVAISTLHYGYTLTFQNYSAQSSLSKATDHKAKLNDIQIDSSKSKKQEYIIPKDIQQWLDMKTACTERQETSEFDSQRFFKRDNAIIVGYINGYNTNMGFTHGIIYQQYVMTGDDKPITIQIYPDGRFEGLLPVFHPTMQNLLINDQRVPFYVEPGQSLGILLNWDKSMGVEHIIYLGKNKKINDELAKIVINNPDYHSFRDLQKNQEPNLFLANQLTAWNNEVERINTILNDGELSPRTQQIIRNEVNIRYANYIFEYNLSRDYLAKRDSANKILKIPIDLSFYKFINRINLDDSSLLVSNSFMSFINRFEFSLLFPMLKYQHEENCEELMLSDFKSIYKSNKTPLVYHIAGLRRLKGMLNNASTDSVANMAINNYLAYATDSIYKEEVNRLKQLAERKNLGYELPNTIGANVFKKIVQPYRGKILVIDFWAQWCGPCLAGIEGSLSKRKALEDNPHLDFVFITDERGTPDADFFDTYNKTNFLKNSYRITADEYLLLRELFKFNGIPRYILVNDKGRIMDDDFAYHNLDYELKRIFPEKFNNEFL